MNNPVNFTDSSGLVATPINVITAVLGAGGGAMLGRLVADYFGLTGLRRYAVIAGFTVGGAIIGYFAPGVVEKLAYQVKIALGITTGAAVVVNQQRPNNRTLLYSANQPDRGGLTRAGRPLEKHGGRPGGQLPVATGNVAQKNALGNQILESMLNHPSAIAATRHHARYGYILEIQISGGLGARFSADGTAFIGFMD